MIVVNIIMILCIMLVGGVLWGYGMDRELTADIRKIMRGASVLLGAVSIVLTFSLVMELMT